MRANPPGGTDPLPGEAKALDERPLAAVLPLFSAIRAYRFVVIAIALGTLALCGAWLLQRTPSYQARAQILVTPLVEGETAFVGLPIVRTSPGDPTRTVATAASIVSSPEAARLAASQIDGTTGDRIRGAIIVQPIEDTNVIDVAANASDPELAAEMASRYAEAVLEVRRRELKPMVREEIRRTQKQLETIPDPTGATAVELRTKLSQLGTISDGTDPTLSIAQLADVPDSPTGQPAWLLLLAAGVAGLLLGVGTAVMLRMTTPLRVEGDETLADILDLPVLVRIPAADSSARARRRAGDERSAEIRASFRQLAAQLAFRTTARYETTSPAGPPGPGTATAILSVESADDATSYSAELTTALIDRGATVVTVGLDRGGRALSTRLGVEPREKVTTSTDPDAPLIEVLEPASDHRPLGVVTADPEAPALRPLLAEAKARADEVVLDMGSAIEARDALSLLHDVDVIVIVVWVGRTRSEGLARVAELLKGTGVLKRAGYLVVER